MGSRLLQADSSTQALSNPPAREIDWVDQISGLTYRVVATLSDTAALGSAPVSEAAWLPGGGSKHGEGTCRKVVGQD